MTLPTRPIRRSRTRSRAPRGIRARLRRRSPSGSSRSPLPDRRSPGRKFATSMSRSRSRSPSPYRRSSCSPDDSRHSRQSSRMDSPQRMDSSPRCRRRGRSPVRESERASFSKYIERFSISKYLESVGTSLLIAGLNQIITEKDMKKKFSSFGRVLDVCIIKNKRTGESRGLGFLRIERDEDADAAIKALDQTIWNGRILLVEKFNEHQDQ